MAVSRVMEKDTELCVCVCVSEWEGGLHAHWNAKTDGSAASMAGRQQ